jgi:3-dehydroquinate synthase
LLSAIGGPRFAITDAHVAPHLPPIAYPLLVIEPGEASKGIATYSLVLEWLAESQARRDATLIAIGGGVVGDLAGFVAATYMRGIALVQVPTTLMGQVDSAIGGKTAIDLKAGKNLAGAFHAPDAILVDVQMLATLPAREFVSGAAEVWKYGAILDAELLAELERAPLSPDRTDLARIVRRCAEHKARVVEEDEFERLGRRAILNFGHTIGHAVEAAMGFGPLTHGEAVAIGMVAEARLGETIGLTEAGVADRLRRGLSRQGLPTEIPPGLEPRELMAWMGRDKKAGADGLAFSLLPAVGRCTLVRGVDESAVLDVLKQE